MSKLLESIYVKMLFGAIIAFAGVAGGIYVGFALVDKSPMETGVSRPATTGDNEVQPWLEFNDGDLFPLDDYFELDGSVAGFEQLLQGKKTVLIFTSFGCEPCSNLLKTWARDVAPKLTADVQVVVCATRDADGVPDEYRPLLEKAKLIYYDERYYRDKYHLAFFPTVIGVDASGFVQHIQFGFDGTIDYEIMDYFTNSNR